jgi:hypothetical protein
MAPGLPRGFATSNAEVLLLPFSPISRMSIPRYDSSSGLPPKSRLMPRVFRDRQILYASGISLWKFLIPLLRRDDVSWGPHVTYLLIGISRLRESEFQRYLVLRTFETPNPDFFRSSDTRPNDGRFRSNLGLHRLQSQSTHLYEPSDGR